MKNNIANRPFSLCLLLLLALFSIHCKKSNDPSATVVPTTPTTVFAKEFNFSIPDGTNSITLSDGKKLDFTNKSDNYITISVNSEKSLLLNFLSGQKELSKLDVGNFSIYGSNIKFTSASGEDLKTFDKLNIVSKKNFLEDKRSKLDLITQIITTSFPALDAYDSSLTNAIYSSNSSSFHSLDSLAMTFLFNSRLGKVNLDIDLSIIAPFDAMTTKTALLETTQLALKN